MVRSLFMGLWLLGLGVFALALGPGYAQDAASPTSVVERFHTTLADNMRQGKALGFDGRRAKLEPVVKTAFDLQGMTRISTGAGWRKLSEAERADVIGAFTAWTVANYAGNFAEDDGSLKFETKSQSPEDAKGNVVVNTQLIVKGEPPVLFNYRLRKVDGAWKIVDVYLDGAISQLATRRAEFAAVLARGSAADLVAHMHKLAKDAEKSSAK